MSIRLREKKACSGWTFINWLILVGVRRGKSLFQRAQPRKQENKKKQRQAPMSENRRWQCSVLKIIRLEGRIRLPLPLPPVEYIPKPHNSSTWLFLAHHPAMSHQWCHDHRRKARAFRAFTVKAHFVVQSGSVVHWRQKNREKKSKKRKKIDKRKEK